MKNDIWLLRNNGTNIKLSLPSEAIFFPTPYIGPLKLLVTYNEAMTDVTVLFFICALDNEVVISLHIKE
jgi:hypothetical protein